MQLKESGEMKSEISAIMGPRCEMSNPGQVMVFNTPSAYFIPEEIDDWVPYDRSLRQDETRNAVNFDS